MITRYWLVQGIQPCRAERVVKNSWWITEPIRGFDRSKDMLIFLKSNDGDIPQCSSDEDVMYIMKRKLFPWADVRWLPQVYLVRHGRQGWQVPYGLIY